MLYLRGEHGAVGDVGRRKGMKVRMAQPRAAETEEPGLGRAGKGIFA